MYIKETKKQIKTKKTTEKQLKRTKSKKLKGLKRVCHSCQNSFVSLNVEGISIALNSCFVSFCFCLFNMHLKKERVLAPSIKYYLKKRLTEQQK